MTDLDQRAGPAEATEGPWHLSGNFAPVGDERDAGGLRIDGELPDALRGTYYRNGFDPRHGHSDHWFYGHGMVHAVTVGDGVASYRNRWVRTPYWEQGEADLNALLDPANSPANTHVVPHSGSLLALEEVHAPYRVDVDLETLGVETIGGPLAAPDTAHPRVCPEGG
ncbi:MAG: carotenoid oxygenase family protein, partial [Actinomycetota bacterium]